MIDEFVFSKFGGRVERCTTKSALQDVDSSEGLRMLSAKFRAKVERLPLLRQMVDVRTRATGATMACPCCESSELLGIQQKLDLHGRIVRISECTNCHAYINATDLSEALANSTLLKDQADGAEAYYTNSPRNITEEVDKCDKMLSHLVSLVDCGRGMMLDFGAGLGLLASAGTRYFDQVYALEPSVGMLQASHRFLPDGDRIRSVTDLSEVPSGIDAVTIWHVLEHLPFMLRDLRAVVAKLRKGGAAFIQVPMFDTRHLFHSHYTFLNEPSCHRLCAKAGLGIVAILFDHQLNYLTCIAQR